MSMNSAQSGSPSTDGAAAHESGQLDSALIDRMFAEALNTFPTPSRQSANRKLADAGKEWVQKVCKVRYLALPAPTSNAAHKTKAWNTLKTKVDEHQSEFKDQGLALPAEKPAEWKDMLEALRVLVNGYIKRMVNGQTYPELNAKASAMDEHTVLEQVHFALFLIWFYESELVADEVLSLARILYQVPINEREKKGDKGKRQDGTTSVSGAEIRSNMSGGPNRAASTTDTPKPQSMFTPSFSKETKTANPSMDQTAEDASRSARLIERAFQKFKELRSKMSGKKDTTRGSHESGDRSSLGDLSTNPLTTAPSGGTAGPSHSDKFPAH